MWNQQFLPAYNLYAQPQQPLFYPLYFIPVLTGNQGQPDGNLSNSLTTQLTSQTPQITSLEAPLQPSCSLLNEKQIQESVESIDSVVMKKKSKNILQSNSLSQKSTNIQKNYAKAIVQYILRQRIEVLKYLGEKQGIEFLKLLTQLKNNIKNVKHLIKYTNDDKQQKLFRILSNRFLKKEAIGYVYNSNIKSTSQHILYRHLIQLNLQKC
ncbi:unnamed protein product (macronuclear) [Paramecium tetraurelia]|uniref:Chromosome undetermined scaffold_1, whole genome shotgun sequence n=1 Tax=Paramecium tetraurelia TaxID=5888 RepID=Q6BFW2_PARTE|nr:hypothetical protein [Paramecium tetraurelia strain d4-2]XP_001423218.1 uncharacterized protein GSPATT00000255001 [Paramecium tetraurelia]CAH03458.1 hypothetical protein PTMB.260c [Paramecium tetraurelia]CAK55820.1 unnamed protein product [Paramecium tetraurelia]|eukprot:XP_001423218.1 hypothetical protein (macronuclear) [Paramecium tetraurelia strain d4-2]